MKIMLMVWNSLKFWLLLLILVSCYSHKDKREVDQVLQNINIKDDNLEELSERNRYSDHIETKARIFKQLDSTHVQYTSSLKTNDFTIIIESICLLDTLDENYVINKSATTPIVEKQKIIFKEKDEILKEYILPIKLVNRLNLKGKKIKSFETPIWKICIYQNTKSYYGIHGVGLCTGSECPEFFGLYTMKGEIIFEGNLNELSKSKGSFREMLNENNINDSIFYDAEKNATRIDKWY